MVAKEQQLWRELSPAEQRKIQQLLSGKKAQPEAKLRPQRPPSFQLKGYVRAEFSSADKANFVAWSGGLQKGDLWEVLVKALSDGYLFKCGVGKEGYTASLSAFDTGKSYDGYVLTAFAGDPEKAALAVMFKHLVMLDGDWGAYAEENTEDFLR